MTAPNGFVIENLSIDDFDDIKVIADLFTLEEPIARGLHATAKDYEDFFNIKLVGWLNSGFSVAIKDMTSKTFAGVLLAEKVTKQDLYTWGGVDSYTSNEKVKMDGWIMSKVEGSLEQLFQTDPTLTAIVDHALIYIQSDYRGKGLGHLMIKASNELAEMDGCQLSSASCTSVPSQRVYSKMNYQEHFRLDYKDLVYEGKNVLDLSVMLGATCIVQMVKRLIT